MKQGESGDSDTFSAALRQIAAKTDPTDENMWLPLVIHLQDTASVMEYLVTSWLPERYCESLGLSREEFFRLARIAALLHDVGKATPCFEWRIMDRRPELRAKLESKGLNVQAEYRRDQQIPHALAGAEILRTHGFGEGLASVVSAHHGKPGSFGDVDISERLPKSMGWTGTGNRDTPWGQAQRELMQWALDEVGAEGPEDVPECTMAAQMLLSGLVIMADWIASNTEYFPLISMDELPERYDPERAERALRRLRLPKAWKVSPDWNSADYFERRFGFSANGMQKTVERAAESMKTPGVMILEAPMGQGKTEAALAAAEILMNRFSLGGAAFFLPSQATANAMFPRMTRWAETQPDLPRITVELIHGQADLNEEFRSLEQGSVQVEQGENAETLTVHSFFRGRKTRLLANLVVGTIDQLLMAALQQKHVMLRHLGLAGKVVIIDECHTYDAYMNAYLDRALDWLGAYGVPVILLSATLPGQRRGALLQAYLGNPKPAAPEIQRCEEYPLLSWTEQGRIRWEPIAPEGISRRVQILRAEEDRALEMLDECLKTGCAGIIVNTVKRAQELRERLEERYGSTITILMDHSRFLAPDRAEKERQILDRVGKHSIPERRKGVLVIGTQVLEQSLDLDFDLLITDLCPMDLLLQRIGRLHRHPRIRPRGLETAKCIVLGTEGELESGTEAVYGEYLLLRTRELLPEEIRLSEDISPLVQKTYDGIRWDPELGAQYDKSKEKYQKEQGSKKSRAGAHRLEPPERDEPDITIDGLLDESPGTTDLKAQAAVRDGNAAIEILVVQRTEDGSAKLLSGEQKGKCLRCDTSPGGEEARTISTQRLRLPARFGLSRCVGRVLEELEDQTRTYLSMWRQAPILEAELFLILDPDGKAELDGETLYYDPEMGLREKEESNGEN